MADPEPAAPIAWMCFACNALMLERDDDHPCTSVWIPLYHGLVSAEGPSDPELRESFREG